MASLINVREAPSLSKASELPFCPVIDLQNELLNTSALRFGTESYMPQNFLLPVHETVLKRITRTFFENGFWDALAEARNESTRQEAPWIGKTFNYVAELLGIYSKLKLRLFPHTQALSDQRIAQYVETRDWLDSCIRCIAWHCHVLKLAVAGGDDVVRIYNKNSHDGPSLVIKRSIHAQITCMSWRPLCASELVIGCRAGLCFWIIDSNFHLTRPSTPNLTLQHPSKLPITSMQWNKNGSLLATASIGDSSILIWQPEMGIVQPLKHLGPPGSLLKWSPSNEYLFAGTVGRIFWVWHCDPTWTSERWKCNGGTVQTATWSPCGRFLLFVTTAEPILYSLQFIQQHLHQCDNEVMAIADLSACPLNGNNQTLIGGNAQQLVWDPHGQFLVVTFKATNYIAVFRTAINKFDMHLSTAFYLAGETQTEHPSYVCFKPLHKDNDRSMLTIAWSSGRIQYYAFN
ncbi:aladin [Scaptodrosophila lebanonensis]|uniref:Aladin n=1 Tax=Drosophila lebanonensis TaxID=7225 RepID=A0A6J2TUA0_DROLE|nr:aladin [Scaptodrosophila lebanonensis]